MAKGNKEKNEAVRILIMRERKRLGLSQVDLAKRLNTAQTTISDWEIGRSLPGLEYLLLLNEVLGLDLQGIRTFDKPAERVSEPDVSYIYDTPRLDRVLPIYNMGHIAGTTDIEPFIDGEVGISAEMAKLADAVIRIHGTSMLPFFRDGDLVGIKKTPVAQPKQIVLAAVEGEMTFKRLGKISRGWVLLMPFNPEHDPIQSRDIQILGVFRWLLRLRPDGKL